jgi:uncharacterized protein (TIGR02677 family)
VGEAAHRAVLDVEATIAKRGSLQATMLAKIRDALRGLASEAATAQPDADRLQGLLHDLHASFETLTLEANRFIGDLNRQTESEEVDEERFALRKQAVLAYISRFVQELRRLKGEISAGIEAVAFAGIDGILHRAADSKDMPPNIGEGDTRAAWIERERARWDGLAAWFIGDGCGTEATVERLAQVAVSAVVALTRTLGRLNDRRGQAVDRAADFRTLARWFSACRTDHEAHELWQVAFGLYPARHFHIEEEDEESTGPRVSWWDAAPVTVPVSVRSRGRASRAGRAAAVPDYSGQRSWIAQCRRREREQLEAAVARFADRGALRLSDIAELEEAEFDLLLSLLDEALVAPRADDGSHTTRTSDGRLKIVLRRPRPDDDDEVTLKTPRGLLRCRNYLVEVKQTARTAHTASKGVAG